MAGVSKLRTKRFRELCCACQTSPNVAPGCPAETGAAGRCAPGGAGGACSANGNCDGITSHSSIRVYHRLHDTQLDPHSGWLLKDEANKLEKNCYVHHRCGMGVVTGDTSKCQCKQM